MKKFQNLTVDFTTLSSMSATDRLAVVRSASRNSSILSDISPEQLASLFPSYYLKRLPDIGISGRRDADGNIKTPLSQRYARESDEPHGATPSWSRRQQQDTSRERSDPSAKAQLSREQKEVMDLLRKGKIDIDDPRVAFLGKLSDDDLRAAGITRREEDGKKYYGSESTVEKMSDEEIAKTVQQHEIGKITSKYESGGRGVSVISSGRGDPGGVSYGAHQLASKTGTMSAFLRSPEAQQYAEQFRGLEPGSSAFNAVYKRVASQEAESFAKAQQAFIIRTHFDPVKEQAKRAGFNVDDPKVQETLYSMSVQHGRARSIVGSLGDMAGRSPEDQVKALFAARRQYVDGLGMSHLRNRYASEERDILGLQARTGDLTPEQIIEQRKKLVEQEQSRRNDALAARLNPSGSSAERVVRRDRGRDLDEEVSASVHTEMGIQLTGGAARRGYSSSLNGMDPELLGRYHRAVQQLPSELRSKLKITSAFRDPNDPEIQAMYEAWKRNPDPNKKPMADPRRSKHGQGRALDIQLGHLSDEERRMVENSFRGSGLKAPVRSEGFRDSHTHIEPDEAYQGESAAASYQQRMQALIQQRKEQIQTARQERSNPSTTTNQAAVAAEPGQQAPQQQAPQQQSATPAVGATPVNQAALAPEAEVTPISVNAKGGTENVNADEIKALPIGGTKGDNSVVVDNNANPLFTMNTKRESAAYDPDSGQVSVKPKTDGDSLKEPEKQLSETSNQTSTVRDNEPMQNQGFATQSIVPNRYADPGTSLARDLTDKVIKDPSFERAVGRSRFVNTGDPVMGGHFDGGASNMS
jgi:hypothetical protein